MILSRLLCLKSPFKASAFIPSLLRFLAIFSVLCFVLAKTRTAPSLFSSWSIRVLYLFVLSTFITSCLIFFNKVFSVSIVILSGFFKYFFDKVIIFFGKVAENIKVCLSWGINFKI